MTSQVLRRNLLKLPVLKMHPARLCLRLADGKDEVLCHETVQGALPHVDLASPADGAHGPVRSVQTAVSLSRLQCHIFIQ